MRCCRRVQSSEIAPRTSIRQRRSMRNLFGHKRSGPLLPRSEPMVKSERWREGGPFRTFSIMSKICLNQRGKQTSSALPVHLNSHLTGLYSTT
jgi:hypothetical protein